jgi:hypothetical protein
MISFKTIYYEDIEPSIQDQIKNATSFEQALDLICSDDNLFANFVSEFGFDTFSGYLHILKKHEYSIAKYSWSSVEYAKFLMQNNKPISKIIEQGIAEDSGRSYDYAKYLIDNNKPVSEIIERGIAQYARHSYDYAKWLIQNNTPVPDFIEQRIAQYSGH